MGNDSRRFCFELFAVGDFFLWRVVVGFPQYRSNPAGINIYRR